MAQIDKDTLITKGLQLSRNFIIDHTSVGAFHYTMGKIVPSFTSFMLPGTKGSGFDWQVARNLQLGSENILEGLLSGFGGDLIIRSAFTGSGLGQSFDIQVNGFQKNMYSISKEIEKLSGAARSLSFNYGATSFARINFDEKSIFTKGIQEISSVDLLNNVVEKGITSIKGFI